MDWEIPANWAPPDRNEQYEGSREFGFTLLEVMVATLIMGVAVIGLLANLHGSLRNTERIGSYDRATLFAQHKMDELIAQPRLPLNLKTQGCFSGGWRPFARWLERRSDGMGSPAARTGWRTGSGSD